MPHLCTSSLQSLQQCASASKADLTWFSPAVLRSALKRAGKIIQAEHINDVLEYCISDGQYAELDQLSLLLLADGSIQQFSTASQADILFAPVGRGRDLYKLMPASKHRQVQRLPVWHIISR